MKLTQISFSFITIFIALISSCNFLHLRQTIPPYRWNANINDIKQEYVVQNTVQNLINTGEVKSKFEYNPAQYAILPNDTKFYNSSDTSSYYSKDPNPYYPIKNNITAPVLVPRGVPPQNPTYQKDPLPYYTPLFLPRGIKPLEIQGVPVNVEIADLWMDTPTEENWTKLKSELNWLLNKRGENVYYDGSAGDRINKINFWKEKINVMRVQLNQTDYSVDDDVNRVWTNGMKRVDIIQGWNYTSNATGKNYYLGQKKEVAEAEGVGVILGEKYVKESEEKNKEKEIK